MKKIISIILVLTTLAVILTGCMKEASTVYTAVDGLSQELAEKFVEGKQLLAEDFHETTKFIALKWTERSPLSDKDGNVWYKLSFLKEDAFNLLISGNRQLRLIKSSNAVDKFSVEDTCLLLGNVDCVTLDAEIAKGRAAIVLEFLEDDFSSFYDGQLWYLGSATGKNLSLVSQLSLGSYLLLDEGEKGQVATAHDTLVPAWSGSVTVLGDNITYVPATGLLTFEGAVPDPLVHDCSNDGKATCTKQASITCRWDGTAFQTVSAVFSAPTNETESNVSTDVG